ncbi:MAG: glycosyltransferase family 9 protein [Deltaproteobacteria bacterium]|nr:glycosyltransferase family 9 protein [Deltaproteobacteria bacterium]
MIYIALTYLFSPILYLLLFFRKKDIRRILVIQTAKIGDLICSTPVFRAIKKKYPDARLSVMVNPVTRELLEHNPYINEIIPLQKDFYKGFTGKVRLAVLFRKGRYDVSISLNPNVPFTLAMFWGLIPVRISIMPDFAGITYKMASVFSTYLERHIRGRLVADTYMRMLKGIGMEGNDISKDIFKSPDADNKIERFLNRENSKFKIGIAVTSGNRLKEWGVEKIASLVDRLITELNVCIVLIGSETDKDVSDRILKTTEQRDMIIDAVGKFTIGELPALIQRLSLFIGVDTGIIYMADALNVPIVDIAGPADMQDQRPTGKKVVIIQKKLSCVPCSHAFKAPYSCQYWHRECITSITVEEVFEGVSRLMA